MSVQTTHPAVPTQAQPSAAQALRGLCGDAVLLPGDPGYDDARRPWNVAVDQRPAAIAHPTGTAHVAEVVRAAARAGLRVAVQGTGHNAGPLGDLSGSVLLRTAAMSRVTVDPDAARVRVQAGALWLDVVEAASPHGLAVLHGSSPDVGVVGYTLGGGMGWYARALGLACHKITAAEVVTADGVVHQVDAEHEPELLWALRGGGGNVGIVTELEFAAFRFGTAYAGMLVWDLAAADAVLRTWAEWAPAAPESVTTSLRLMRFPPLEVVPAPLRGRRLVMVDGAVLADDAEAERILAPLRALGPELDTFGRVPTEAVVRVHGDPEEPTPSVSTTSVLAGLPAAGVDRLLELAGPDADLSLLMVELRQLGGATTRPAPVPSALSCLDGEFVLFALGMAPVPALAEHGRAEAQRVVEAMRPWANERHYLNFAEDAVDAASGYDPASAQQLARLREQLDPTGVLQPNHPVRG